MISRNPAGESACPTKTPHHQQLYALVGQALSPARYALAWFRPVSLLLLCAAAAPAQITGNLYGTVTDPAGAVIQNAQVTATSAERGNTRTAVSNGLGQWVLTELPIGTYDLKV